MQFCKAVFDLNSTCDFIALSNLLRNSPRTSKQTNKERKDRVPHSPNLLQTGTFRAGLKGGVTDKRGIRICLPVHCLSASPGPATVLSHKCCVPVIPLLLTARPNCSQQSLAGTVSALVVATTSYCHLDRHANVITPCLPTP